MTEPITTVLLASHNTKKLAELRRIVDAAGARFAVLGLGDVDPYPEPDETEWTFEGNALLKAREACRRTGLPALADDSGLAVDVFNGMPGVRSARWAGPGATDEQNLELLLGQLADVADDQRTARFVCAMALVLPDGREEVLTREMPGRFGRSIKGLNGFGYDPAFIADEAPGDEVRTNAELEPDEKDAISHRGQAVRAMVSLIGEWL